MIQMYFPFFHVEIIRAFTPTFPAICSDTSYSFGFPYRNKQPTLDILIFLSNTLKNRNETVSFIHVDEDGALETFSELMRICHNIYNIHHISEN